MQTAGAILRSLLLFLIAGVCEIGGGWLVWKWLRDGRPGWWGLFGALVLVLYGLIPTLQASHFGRIYAVYGGFFIVLSLLWGWAFDGSLPDRPDVLGAGIALVGVCVMMYWPRTAEKKPPEKDRASASPGREDKELSAIWGALAALAQVLKGGFLCPVDDSLKGVPEVAAVWRAGYEIGFHRPRPSPKPVKWIFKVRWSWRTVGRLDADFMEADRWLYVANVFVAEKHGRKGLATALLLCAAKTTGCTVITTSGRTRQGKGFFEKNRAVLATYGIRLLDHLPRSASRPRKSSPG